MVIQTYRSALERVLKDIANLNVKIATERSKAARYSGELHRLQSSVVRSSSLSSAQSKLRQVDSKSKQLNGIAKLISSLEGKLAAKTRDLHAAQRRLETEESRLRKQGSEATRRDQGERLRAERLITSELQSQTLLRAKLLPSSITVAFCAADPYDSNNLKLDEEVRDIEQKIRMSTYRDNVKLISRWAMRITDFMQMMNEVKPHVIHFSGHGSDDGAVVFVGDDKYPHFVSVEAVVQIVTATNENLRVAMFNACFSDSQAQAIVKCVDAAVGMKRYIGDDAAREFAAQFYSAVGFGKSMKTAFEQGCAALAAKYPDERDNPTLHVASSINAETMFLIDLSPSFGGGIEENITLTGIDR